MKNFILFFSCLLLISSANANEKNRNYIEINLPRVGDKFYPRILIEDQENFSTTTNFGIWALAELSGLHFTPDLWKNRGCNLDNNYVFNLKAGITYSYIYSKIIVGAGHSATRSYLSPLLGYSFNKKNIHFQAVGLLDIDNPYKSHYIQEEGENPQYVEGFDPNSWYKIKFLYSISKNLDIGILSERFYGTGIISEYNLNNFLQFKFMFGREIEFSENVYQFGLIFKI